MRIKWHVSRAILKIWHFYWGENKVKISLIFLTSETLDFESEHVFESHKHLQSTADMMPTFTCFFMDQIWAKSGQIRPKQQILKVETRDFSSL